MSVNMSTVIDNNKSPFEIITIDDYSATCEKIPVSSIDKIDIVKCSNPSERISQFYNRQSTKPDIIINGGLFNMSTGHNVMSFVDEGVEQNYQNGFIGFGTTNDKYNTIQYGVDNQGNWKDFMTAYPVLVKDYKNTTNSEWGNASSINYNAARQIVGYDNEYLYILTIDAKIKFDVAQEIINSIGMQYAFNLDGGGSVRKMRFGEVVNRPTEDRPVDSVLCVYLKDSEHVTELPAKYTVDVITTLNVRSEPNGTILGVLYPEDIIIVYDVDDGWAKFKYDVGNVEYAYCSMEYLTFIEKYEEPEDGNNNTNSVLDKFNDKDDISDCAKNAVEFCVKNGFIDSDGDLKPKSPLSLEQFCMFIYKIMNQKE